MSQIVLTGDALWARMERAVEKVRERLERAALALEKAGIDYAVVGGNAVQIWVAQVDEAAVRNTRDVDILLRRADLPAAVDALEAAGFQFRQSSGLTMFLDGENAKARDAVRIVFAGEPVREGHVAQAPDVEDYENVQNFRTIKLEALVQMKLTSYRDKDRTHLRDFIDVGQIDETWPSKFSDELGERLQALLDTPDG